MSEFVSDVSTRKWGEEVLGSEAPVLGDFWGRLVRTVPRGEPHP